ncbi:MAG: UDP-N-acetylglucosamine--N-acetylmuramyl-(pentapeptide) pyrophosphoryl-undecaprenol N-acetylglucosamine transferase [Merismopedia sp. SIO2A8]|nr:UDP-N-acetylglucosamine--N-acetylmuramyl-(pentapeptide) pyrophosphoryl-undecaprenol N-acetylglucosamine transferase [Merismopedia sp. SIO2A8]
MPQPTLYVAMTNHGFGHTTRTSAVITEIQQHYPDLRVIVASTAPPWLINSYIKADYELRPQAFDIGVIQSDSITMDKAATLEKLQHIQSQQDAIIASEAEFLRQNQVGLVLGDIPPLLTKIAHSADVPCWMMSNFGWDFIYRDWINDIDSGFTNIIDWIHECFQECDRLFRLPFHEPMSAFPVIEDVGLTGGTPNYSVDELRRLFNISAPPEKTVLLTFGGLGLTDVPYEKLLERSDWQFITFDHQPPSHFPNLLKITDRTYRPVDIMPLCGQIISKPGYSTFAEACRVGVPITSVERHGFAEAPILLEGIQQYTRHQIISLDELYAGQWEFLDRPFQPAIAPEALPGDGNKAIAQAVMQYFQRLTL